MPALHYQPALVDVGRNGLYGILRSIVRYRLTKIDRSPSRTVGLYADNRKIRLERDFEASMPSLMPRRTYHSISTVTSDVPQSSVPIERIVSGGQTGVDRAALDAALLLGIPCGGWCPYGRRAEDGLIPPRYPMRETSSAAYPERTEWNVRDSNGTLILGWGRPRGGSALTARLARRYRRPLLILDLLKKPPPRAIAEWLMTNDISILNVAGPRESEAPGIHDRALAFLREALEETRATNRERS
jgi:hypothetical protein